MQALVLPLALLKYINVNDFESQDDDHAQYCKCANNVALIQGHIYC